MFAFAHVFPVHLERHWARRAEGQHRLVVQGEVELIGSPSLDWVGVPLKAGGKSMTLVASCSFQVT